MKPRSLACKNLKSSSKVYALYIWKALASKRQPADAAMSGFHHRSQTLWREDLGLLELCVTAAVWEGDDCGMMACKGSTNGCLLVR